MCHAALNLLPPCSFPACRPALPVPQLQVLPQDIRDPLVSHPKRASLLEVVLDLGRRPEARFLGERGGEYLREQEVGGGELGPSI